MNNATIPAITTIVVSETTTVPVERVLAAASDFSPRRYSVFPAVSAKHTTVHAVAETSADVTEGTRVGPLVIWERCDYDWSQPGRVIATVTDSNVYATPGSSWTITAEAAAGATRVEMTWCRRFRRRPLGRFMGFMYRTIGRRSFTKYARDTLNNLEAIFGQAA
jgi:hypothetical protein